MSKKKFEQYLEEAQRFRAACFHAEFDMLLFLVEFETSDTWRDAGFNTFATVIREYKLTRPERFAEFKVARKKLDDDETIRTIGVEAALQAHKIPTSKARAEYLQEAKIRVKNDGFPWTKEQAERTRMRISPDLPKPLTRVASMNRTEKELAEAEALIDTLRLELAEAEAQIEQLKKENQQLNKQLKEKLRGAPQPQPTT
jgi:chromosome segregation ATPase